MQGIKKQKRGRIYWMKLQAMITVVGILVSVIGILVSVVIAFFKT